MTEKKRKMHSPSAVTKTGWTVDGNCWGDGVVDDNVELLQGYWFVWYWEEGEKEVEEG